MIPLIQQTLLHLVRSKLVLLWLIFSFIVQFFSLEILGSISVSVNRVMTVLGVAETVGIAFLIELVTFIFLVVLYAIAIVPYLHRGSRVQLVFALPINRWHFPAVYTLILGGLMLLQFLTMLLALGLALDFSVFSDEIFPWRALLGAAVVQFLVSVLLMFYFSLGALFWGKIQAVLLGGIGIFVLLIMRFITHSDFFLQGEGKTWMKTIYHALPPFGDLVHHLKAQFDSPLVTDPAHLKWVVWIAIGVVVFHYKLGRPELTKSAE